MQRTTSIVVAAVCWIAWIAFPVRVLFFTTIPNSDRGDGMRTAGWIAFCFLAAMGAIFTYRAWRGGSAKGSS